MFGKDGLRRLGVVDAYGLGMCNMGLPRPVESVLHVPHSWHSRTKRIVVMIYDQFVSTWYKTRVASKALPPWTVKGLLSLPVVQCPQHVSAFVSTWYNDDLRFAG